jgi:hypothetical protein
VPLTRKSFEVKIKILREVYFSETEKLVHLLPCTFVEGFTQFSWDEVSELYQYLSQNKILDQTNLHHYKEVVKLLPSYRAITQVRPF